MHFFFSGFSRNMVLSLMMYLFGFTQLSSIHLGHDRNFTLLMYNENATRVSRVLTPYTNCTIHAIHRSMATSVPKMC